LANEEPDFRVIIYHKATNANRGPDYPISVPSFDIYPMRIPDVIAIKSIKTDRSGYLSPIVEDTDGNHSSG
jgi:hypothetical protein